MGKKVRMKEGRKKRRKTATSLLQFKQQLTSPGQFLRRKVQSTRWGKIHFNANVLLEKPRRTNTCQGALTDNY